MNSRKDAYAAMDAALRLPGSCDRSLALIFDTAKVRVYNWRTAIHSRWHMNATIASGERQQ
jgi:hypothetical protein